MSHPVLIIGSGLAGYTLAREFRKLDKITPLVIVSRDHAGFYSKPMLSNALASQKSAATLVMKDAEKMASELNATIHPHTGLREIDVQGQAVRLTQGSDIKYRDLVLAVGADPIRLRPDGDAAQEVLSVNDLSDYGHFVERLNTARCVTILGAGLIGCEFANDFLHRGITPTVIDLAQHALPRLLPQAAAARLEAQLSAAGVQFRWGVSLLKVDHAAQGGYRLHLSDGSESVTDLVLSAVGLQPRVDLARAAGLAVHRGIVTDRRLQTSSDHVHALGDCAEVDGHSLPYVMPIMQQARALAATLAGSPTQVTYPPMPVTVKTPACPTVVCPPEAGATGTWEVKLTDSACEAFFRNDAGQLLGFALLGSATSQRQTLTAQVSGLWG